MRVTEVMTTNVRTVRPETPAADAWELMRRERIHHLVVMKGSTVVGVLSNRDKEKAKDASQSANPRVEDVMTTTVVTVAANETIRQVANLMRGRTIGCVPVVQGRQLKGIITVSDLLELLGRGVDRPAKPPRHDLHYRVPHRKRVNAPAAW